MSDLHADADLDRTLSELREHVEFPATPELMPSVHRRLQTAPKRRGFLPVPFPGRLRAGVVALLVAAILALTLTPSSRTAIARWFGIAGISVTRGSLPTGPLGHDLQLGTRVTLDVARSEAPFPILIPTADALGQPDEVYVDTVPGSRRVTLLYHARAGLPRAGTTGVGLLLTEFRAQSNPAFLGKVLGPNTRFDQVQVGADSGYFIFGAPHVLLYAGPHGYFQDHARLAGNTLLWAHGAITLRLESALGEKSSIQIAASVR